MEDTRYGLKVSLQAPYDEAVVRTTDALKAQGFGVLTTIDVTDAQGQTRSRFSQVRDSRRV